MSHIDSFKIDATLVANEFIDKYMAAANGDYVKIYLYLLRNMDKGLNVECIADSLELTERDVKRAITYWENEGILTLNKEINEDSKADKSPSPHVSKKATEPHSMAKGKTGKKGLYLNEDDEKDKALRDSYMSIEGKETVDKLTKDSEFKELLLIIQKYRSRILNESEVQVFAYMYDGLHLPADVIDYLVDYCVDHGHNNIRYMEKVALEWSKIGIATVTAARRRTEEFEQGSKNKEKAAAKKKAPKANDRNEDLDALLIESARRKA